MSQIIDFYRGYEDTECRHHLSDIWTFSFQRMDDVHDFIQWIFPLDEPSAHNPDAPILTREDINEFANDPELRMRLMISVHSYMRFLGLNTRIWVTEFDHNHLRITRMLKCLVLMGMDLEAQARLDEVLTIVKAFDAEEKMAKAIKFWHKAVRPDLDLSRCKDCGTKLPALGRTGGNIILPRDMVCDDCWNHPRYDGYRNHE